MVGRIHHQIENPLHLTIKRKNIELLKFWINKNALTDVSPLAYMRNYKAVTSPLHVAALQKDLSMLKLVHSLCSENSFCQVDSTGSTPLMNCIRVDDADGFAFLFKVNIH
jgi:ankyrin repeat protein